MNFKWDLRKARLNLRKHKVPFEEATTAFSDPMAATGLDPDHSASEDRYVTFGVSERGRLLWWRTPRKVKRFASLALALQAKERERYMKKVRKPNQDELRREYKLSDFPGGLVRGKYAGRLRRSSNIVVLRPEVAEAFPNEEAVNKALLSLIEVAQKTTRLAKRQTGRAKKSHVG